MDRLLKQTSTEFGIFGSPGDSQHLLGGEFNAGVDGEMRHKSRRFLQNRVCARGRARLCLTRCAGSGWQGGPPRSTRSLVGPGQSVRDGTDDVAKPHDLSGRRRQAGRDSQAHGW